MDSNERKVLGIAVFALILSFVAYSYGTGSTNYYNNTTGGGVSFNGSPVDLNGSSFYNGSQLLGTFNHSNLTDLGWGDSGHYFDFQSDIDLNFSVLNMTKKLLIGYFSPYATFEQIVVNSSGSSVVRLESQVANYFFGVRKRYNASGMTGLNHGDLLFQEGGIGSTGSATLSSSGAFTLYYAYGGTWNISSTPSAIIWGTVPVGSTALLNRWMINDSGYLLPVSNKTYDIGSPAYRVRTLYTQTNVIGDLQEDYTYNKTFSYRQGDVVDVDLGPAEVALARENSTRVVGVVAGQENDIVSVVIMGKYDQVKVKGVINKGDTLISGGGGYAVSMYGRSFNVFDVVVKSSVDPAKYNLYVLPGQKVGIAMQSYNGSGGYIPVIIGKG